MQPSPSSASTAATPNDVSAATWVAFTLGPLLREVVATALAGLVTGIVVLGLGGRLVMRAATLLDPGAIGRLTENGNRIGDITLGGTVALILFGGMFFGLGAAIVWTAIWRWLPQQPIRRALVAMPVAVAVSGFLLVEGDNPDFRILDLQPIVIGLLLGLIALFGAVLALVDAAFQRRLPAVRPERLRVAGGYALLVGLGAVLVLPFIVGFYFSADICFCRPERPTGTAIAVAGGATIVAWLLRANGRDPRPPALVAVGRTAVVAAVVLGSLRVIEEIRVILVA
ncbi:MAG TPA: hypothetical protein VFK54_03495 [Candidatus Limnocylindrales bacterium]|nr:hypothetical protein [Candidatus Limnocylindrales bacterium]